MIIDYILYRMMSRLSFVFKFEHVYLVRSEITTSFQRSFLTIGETDYLRDKRNSRRANGEVEVSRFCCVSRLARGGIATTK